MKQYDIANNLPDFLKNIKEFQIIADMVNPELELLRRRIQNIIINISFLDMDECAVSRWEKMLGLIPLASDTLEDRRFRLLLYINGDRPYTYDIIDERLKKLCGANNIHTSVDVENYSYGISATSEITQNQLAEIMKMIRKVLPCNMLSGMTISEQIDSVIYINGLVTCVRDKISVSEQKFNTYGDIKKMTYEDMKNKTYAEWLYKED